MSGEAWRRRWYAPRLKDWRGRVVTRERAQMTGVYFAVVGGLSLLFVAGGGDNPGINGRIFWWASVFTCVLMGYLNLAHAVFNTVPDDEPEGDR